MQIKSRQQAHMDGGMGDTHIEFIFFSSIYIHEYAPLTGKKTHAYK